MKHIIKKAILPLALISTFNAQSTEVKVKIENLTDTGGVFFTPVWVGFHDGTFDSYDTGAAPDPDPEPDPTPCRGGPKKCGSGASADKGNSDFGRGHLVRSNEFYELWVEYHDDGSRTVHHVTLVH